MKPNPRAGLNKQPAIAVRRPRVVARKRRSSVPVGGVVAGVIGAFAVAIGGVYLYDIRERSQGAPESAQTSASAEAAPASAQPQEVASTAKLPEMAENDAAKA